MMSQAAGHVVTECPSCRQPLTGRYCAHCGEKVLDPEALTVRHFILHTLVDELAHLDGKFWRTLRSLMFRPGFLTEEYSAGRRRLYIHPVRLFITTIVTYALLTQGGFVVTLSLYRLQLSIAPTAVPGAVSVAETVTRIDRFGVLANVVAANEKAADTTSEGVRERFHRKLNQFAQPLSFANVVLLALALHLFFHRKRPLFVEHAVFSMHLVSFVLVSSLALLPAVWMLKIDEGASLAWASETRLPALALILIVTIWQFAYLALAIRRFYFGGDPGLRRPRLYAIAAALLIYLLNSAFITAVQIAGAAIALRSI